MADRNRPARVARVWIRYVRATEGEQDIDKLTTMHRHAERFYRWLHTKAGRLAVREKAKA
jgi:hypothetical protein